MRVWAKARNDAVKLRQEGSAARAYFAGGSGFGAQEAVWQQQLESEFAKVSGDDFAAVLLDLRKAYALVQHLTLWGRLRRA
eukprot:2692322-Alexandrium_andersonii.AAC.1